MKIHAIKSTLFGVFIFFSQFTHAATIKCSDVNYGNSRYHENMEELAKQANLPGMYFNRYHETVVSALCRGKERDALGLVETGGIKRSEIEAIREVLGLEKISSQNKSFINVKKKFSDMGLCLSCSDNIADHYVNKPQSKCAKLAKRALEGDQRAIDEIAEFPAFCKSS